PLGRTRAQVAVDAALDDAEQGGVVALVGLVRALRPAQRQLHRALHHAYVDRPAVDAHRRALVEDHHDVAAQHLLDVHRLLGAEEHLRAVGGRGEGHAGLGDLAAVGQREHLEAARVGEDRPVPAREAVQAAVRRDHVQPGAQEQVEGVAEDDLRAGVAHLLRQHALDRAVGADGHERRRLDHAAREGQAAAAGGAVGGDEVELHAGHGWGWAGWWLGGYAGSRSIPARESAHDIPNAVRDLSFGATDRRSLTAFGMTAWER